MHSSLCLVKPFKGRGPGERGLTLPWIGLYVFGMRNINCTRDDNFQILTDQTSYHVQWNYLLFPLKTSEKTLTRQLLLHTLVMVGLNSTMTVRHPRCLKLVMTTPKYIQIKMCPRKEVKPTMKNSGIYEKAIA